MQDEAISLLFLFLFFLKNAQKQTTHHGAISSTVMPFRRDHTRAAIAAHQFPVQKSCNRTQHNPDDQ